MRCNECSMGIPPLLMWELHRQQALTELWLLAMDSVGSWHAKRIYLEMSVDQVYTAFFFYHTQSTQIYKPHDCRCYYIHHVIRAFYNFDAAKTCFLTVASMSGSLVRFLSPSAMSNARVPSFATGRFGRLLNEAAENFNTARVIVRVWIF